MCAWLTSAQPSLEQDGGFNPAHFPLLSTPIFHPTSERLPSIKRGRRARHPASAESSQQPHDLIVSMGNLRQSYIDTI